MRRTKENIHTGFSLVETVLAIAIIGMLVVGILSIFNYALAILAENKGRMGAITLVEKQIELVRNLPYDAIGTVGGIPNGALSATATSTLNNIEYTIATQVVYFDDSFDGTTGGTPSDLLGNDYKKIRVTATWSGRFATKNYVAVTTVAPRGVESTIGGGTLSILVFDANGNPVPQANVTVSNSTLNPQINTTVQSDANGRFLFPGAPASTNGYEISASKTGFSTDKTCAIDPAGSACAAGEGNPTPSKPHATVIAGELTEISFAIDKVSTLVVQTIRQSVPGEWSINTGGNGYDQDNPAMTFCPNGNYLFVWRDQRQNNNPRIYAQQYTPAKVPVWTPDLAVTTSNNQNQPDVAVDGNCNIYYVWQDDRNGNQDIYFKKYTSAGVDAWGGEKKVDLAAQSADQTFPQVVVNASSSAEYLVWQDARNDAGDIYAQKFDPGGNVLWASEIKINSDSSGTVQAMPVITLDQEENIIFIWNDNRSGHNDIWAQKFSRDGIRLWPGDVRLNTDTGTTEQLTPRFILGSDGAIFTVWEDQRNGNSDIYAQRYDASGAPQWTSDVRVNGDAGVAIQANPVIAQLPDTTLLVVWEDNRNGTNDIYLQKLDVSGNKLVAFDARVNGNVTSEQENPDLMISPTGKIVIVWQDNAAGNYDIKAAVYEEDPQTVATVPNVPFTLTGTKRIGENPAIPKFRQTHSTDGAGTITISGLEWDHYTIAPTGYTVVRIEPNQPFILNPDTTMTVILNLE